MNPDGTRTCTVCGRALPPTDFYADPRGRDGLYSRCKPCHNAMTVGLRRWREVSKTDPEAWAAWQASRPPRLPDEERAARRREVRRRVRAKRRADPTKYAVDLAATKRWQAADPEREAARSKRNYARRRADPAVSAHDKEVRRQWALAHPESRAASLHAAGEKRRAAKAGSPGTVSRKDWLAIKAAYRQRCAYCGKPSKRLTMDHIVPLARGGWHVPSNVVPACRPCNTSKGPRPAPTHQPHLAI